VETYVSQRAPEMCGHRLYSKTLDSEKTRLRINVPLKLVRDWRGGSHQKSKVSGWVKEALAEPGRKGVRIGKKSRRGKFHTTAPRTGRAQQGTGKGKKKVFPRREGKRNRVEYSGAAKKKNNHVGQEIGGFLTTAAWCIGKHSRTVF